MKNAYGAVVSITVSWWCPDCEEDHATTANRIDTEYRYCSCCSDEQYVDCVCPKTNEPRRVWV